MRVLFSSTFGSGHVFPMLPLAHAFRAAGHDVLWATSADALGQVTATGLDAVPAGLTGAPRREGVGAVTAAAREVPPTERAAFVFPRMFAALLAPPMAADLLPLARDWQPDLLVHEHAELASPLVGALLGVPSVTHSFGGGIPPPILDAATERLAPLWSEHGLTVPAYAGCFAASYLDICPASVQSVSLDHVPLVQALRPVSERTMPDSAPPVDPVDDGRPLVYVTLGTVQNHSPVLAPVVTALAGLDVRVLVTVGLDGDPATLGAQPSQVRVERWVDQAEALRHCSVVVSHAGSGTFLGALAAGLPQLCLPHAADQFRNATGGVRAGAALVLGPPEVTGDAVAAAVTRLLGEDGFRTGARAVAAEIAAMPSADEVVGVLVGLAGAG